MIKLGKVSITDIFMGNTKIKEVYLGTNKIFSSRQPVSGGPQIVMDINTRDSIRYPRALTWVNSLSTGTEPVLVNTDTVKRYLEDGTVLWEYVNKFDSSSSFQCAVNEYGSSIYLGSTRLGIQKININGALAEQYPAGAKSDTLMVLDEIYIGAGTSDGYINKINKFDGEIYATKKISATNITRMASDSRKHFISGDNYGGIRKYTSNMVPVWEVYTPDNSRVNGLAIDSSDNTYVIGDKIFVLDSFGQFIYTFSDTLYEPLALALDSKGNVYYSNGLSLTRLSNWEKIWDIDIPIYNIINILIDNEDNLYIAGDDKILKFDLGV